MDFELRQAKETWEREQREKKEKARREREREKKAKDEAAKRQQAIESAQLARRLEAAAASLAAQHREEEGLWLGDGIVFDEVLRALAIPGGGDKIRLPPSAFRELSSQNAIDKGPMFFEVAVASSRPIRDGSEEGEEENMKSTHSGVLEFVAHEGYVELPPHVWHNSGLAEASLLGQTNARVRYVRLPKGIYAKFQAEGLDFVDVPNHKAVLETKLRQHASLSVGDLLIVQHAGVEYGLRVTELKPGSSVSVLETDLEADVVAGVMDSNQQVGASAQSRLVPLEIGKPNNGVVSEGQYMYYKFRLDDALAKSVAAGEVDVLVHLEVVDSAEASDADIYVGAHPLLFPTQHNHEWSSHDKGSKVVVLSHPGRQVSVSTYSVGVHGYLGEPRFQILVEAKPSMGQQSRAGQKLGSSTVDQTQEGYEHCGNCKQLVQVAKKFLHEAYCYRHNSLCKEPNCGIVLRKEEMDNHVHCSKCGQALKREELAKHTKIFHEPLRCECGEVLEMEEMVNHRANACPLRSITCRFCGDMVQAGALSDNARDRLRGLTEHESSCGSRTAPCDSCGRAIMLKELDLHKAAAHTPSLSTPHPVSVASTPPRPNDGGTEPRTDPGIRSIRCPICEKNFAGRDSTWRLNEHIDAEHWAADSKGNQIAAPMEAENSNLESHANNVPATFSSRSRTLSVSCPICGMAVHSERDLSFHIDTVH